nr:OmpA family protein [Vibrio stylophorae]
MTFFSFVICWSPFAQATVHYLASPTQSHWQLKQNTPLACQLTHTIPGYGQAMFESRAGKKMNMGLTIEMLRPMGKTRNVELLSMPPNWMAGEAVKRIERVKFYQQFDGYVDGLTAWALLSDLEKGRIPTFSYQDWQHRNELVQVGLSHVGFAAPYQEFSQCIHKLLPYSFEDIAFTVLHYGVDSDELNPASQKRLGQIAEFIRHSTDISLVLVATYTDSSGSKGSNQALSERRAKKLQDYFLSLGLAPDRIEVQAYGERRPIAPNDNPIGKNKNRRVVISLGRSLP